MRAYVGCEQGRPTESVTISHLSSPAANQMDFVFGHLGHSRVPFSDELNILIDLIGLDIVEDDAVHVLASCKDLAEATLDLLVHFSRFGCTVDQVGESASFFVGFFGICQQDKY